MKVQSPTCFCLSGLTASLASFSATYRNSREGSREDTSVVMERMEAQGVHKYSKDF